MTIRTHRPRFLYAFLVVPLLMGAKGKGCCGREAEVDTTSPKEIAEVKVENPIQVTSMDPSSARTNASFTATVYGAAFKEGATAKLNQQAVDGVTVKDANTLALQVPGLATGSYDLTVTNPDGTSATLRRALNVKSSTADCADIRVNFDFDSASLNASSKALLDGKMSCIQGSSGGIAVEGHTDERGTTEYNIALGERRASSVKTYMTNGGVAGSRINTVSFGEEKPLNAGNDDAAWAENRRADIHVAD